ncbi:MAG: amidase family protein [Acidimicrobiaceae bacterium]|nr:amidase family protein [Acidimicrobiaceae bacterium]
MTDDLIRQSARQVVAALAAGDLRPHDALDAVQGRVETVDPVVNALPTRCFDRARDHADRLMAVPPDERGVLAGLPVPIKDLTAVAGVRTTHGSRLMEDFVPEQSDVIVETLEAHGAVVYAKSNTPEFGAGGNTFNDVFGATRNPHDLRLTAGGSSGGAAAAVATGMAWLAHGSDLAGSLRTPASFCGIASLRPSPGRIANGPSVVPFQVHSQQGPMARDIGDLALLTDAMVGESPRAGLGKPPPQRSFRSAAAEPSRPVRVAFSVDLGVAETAPEVSDVCSRAVHALERDGIEIVADYPDLSDARAAFDVPRALLFAALLGDELPEARDILKPELVWNIERGLAIDGDDVRAAIAAQGRIFQLAAEFMDGYDLLVCPAAGVLPFPVEERYVGYRDGLPPSEYYRWLSIAAAVSVTTLPVITIPCGRTETGLPAGIQLIGRPHGELELFSLATHIEQVLAIRPAVVDVVSPD